MKKITIILTSITLSIITLISVGVPVMASNPDKEPITQAYMNLPFLEEGVLEGAAYKIRVPENWNGTLIVYAHGLYADTSLGYLALVIPDPMIAPGSHGGTSIEETLFEMGYALAGSSYSDAGWVVKEGKQDTIALISYFKDTIAKPEQTILWGVSMGGTIAIDIAEKHAGLIDGVVVESSNGVPSTMLFDNFINIQVAYEAIFGWPEEWGSVGDIKDDISWPAVMAACMADIYGWKFVPNPSPEYDELWGRAELFRLIVGGDPLKFYNQYGWFAPLWFTMIAEADLENKAGGNPLQNLGLKDKELSSQDIAYLEDFLGVGVPQALLNEINDHEIVAETSARNYLIHYDTPTGKLKNPVIQLHSLEEYGNHPAGTIMFKETVTNAGKEDLLLQAYTGTGTNHGVYTETQYLQVLAAMMEWLDTGKKPDPDDYFIIPDFVPNPDIPDWPF